MLAPSRGEQPWIELDDAVPFEDPNEFIDEDRIELPGPFPAKLFDRF